MAQIVFRRFHLQEAANLHYKSDVSYFRVYQQHYGMLIYGEHTLIFTGHHSACVCQDFPVSPLHILDYDDPA